MLIYNREEVAKNLFNLFDKYPGWNCESDHALEYYAGGMEEKNDHIQKLFDGTDGRIVIDTDDYEDFMNYLAKQEVKTYLENHFIDDAYSCVPDSMYYDFVVTLRRLYTTLIDNYSWDRNGKVVAPNKVLPVGGQKYTKLFTSVFESALISTGNGLGSNLATTDPVLQKSKINFFKNNIIGGKLASIVTGNKVKENGKYVILSIRPEDLFTISVGNSWRSCMHPDEGEYNTGVLGYICGPDAMVAFTVNKEEYDSSESKLVPKIWREMMFISKAKSRYSDNETVALISQKGYPSPNRPLAEIIASTALELLSWENHGNQKSELYCVREPRGHYGYVDMYQGGKNQLGAVHLKELIEDYKVYPKAQGDMVCIECGEHTDQPSDHSGVCYPCQEGGVHSCITQNWISRRQVLEGETIEINGGMALRSEVVVGENVFYSDRHETYLLKDDCEYVASIDDYVRHRDIEKALDEKGDEVFILKGAGFRWESDQKLHTFVEPENALEQMTQVYKEKAEKYSADEIKDGLKVLSDYISFDEPTERNESNFASVTKALDMLVDLGLLDSHTPTENFEFVWSFGEGKVVLGEGVPSLREADVLQKITVVLAEDRLVFWKRNGSVVQKYYERLAA